MMTTPAERVLKRIESEGRLRFYPIVGRSRGQVLVEQVRMKKPKRILEVGTFIGYSSILMGQELDEGSRTATIEIDRDEAELARKNIREADLKAEVTVHVGDALQVIPTLEGLFNLVFLDAAKWEYYNYLKAIEPMLTSGSVIVADNVRSSSRAMKDYLEYVRDSGNYESRYIRGGWDGIEVSIKK